MNTQFANIATPNEVVVAVTFAIELGQISGEMHICMPYSMIEPIKDLLTSSLQAETWKWTSAGSPDAATDPAGRSRDHC